MSLIDLLAMLPKYELEVLYYDDTEQLGTVICLGRTAKVFGITTAYYCSPLSMGIIQHHLCLESTQMSQAEMLVRFRGKLVDEDLVHRRTVLWDLKSKGEFVKRVIANETAYAEELRAWAARMSEDVSNIPVQDDGGSDR